MMLNLVKVIASDIADIIKLMAGLALLLSLLVVCVAVGTLAAYAIMLNLKDGLLYFDQIIGLRNTGLIEVVRFPIALLNYTVLGFIPLWLVAWPCREYMQNAAARARTLDFKAVNHDEPSDNGGPNLRAAA